MADVTCAVDGCPRTDRMTRGWCYGHYMRWHRTGDVGPVEFQKRKPSPPAQPCTVPGCERPGNIKGDAMCHGHKQRVKLTGEPGPAEFWDLKPRLTECSVDGCERGGKLTRGWCIVHYYSWQRYGDPLTANRQEKKLCSIEGCGRPNSSHGLCTTHALRRKKGTPLDAPIQGALNGSTCLVEGCNQTNGMKRGWCNSHYLSWKRYGDPLVASLPKPVLICIEEGCDRTRYAKDRCFNHYNHQRARDFITQGITCRVEACEKPPATRGLCSGHHTRDRLYGDPRWRSPLKEIGEGPFLVRRVVVEMEATPANQEDASLHPRRGARSHCRRGHTLADALVRKSGARMCRTCQKLRNRRRRLTLKLSPEDRLITSGYLKAIANDPCLYCGGPGAQVDHYYPVRKGGSNLWLNLTMSCAWCNSSKGKRCGTWFLLKGKTPPLAMAA